MALAAGQIVEEEDLAELEAASSAKPIGRLVASGTQSLADNTQVAIAFSAEEVDTGSFHSTTVNNTRVTPTKAGWYRVDGTVFIAALSTGVLADCNIRVNGVNIAPADRQVPGSGNAISVSCTALVECDGVTDYFELVGRQDSAGAVNTNQSVQFSSVLEWEFSRGL